MTLEMCGAECQRRNVGGNPAVMPRKADALGFAPV
jgi:hypothetical protein